MGKRTPKQSWPPDCRDDPEIQTGDGSRWHFLGTAEALHREGVLFQQDTPGDQACPHEWYHVGRYSEQFFAAVRLGENVAVTLLDGDSNVARCIVTKREAAS